MTFFPIRYDNKEHATDLIAVYCTDEYWEFFFKHMRYMGQETMVLFIHHKTNIIYIHFTNVS